MSAGDPEPASPLENLFGRDIARVLNHIRIAIEASHAVISGRTVFPFHGLDYIPSEDDNNLPNLVSLAVEGMAAVEPTAAALEQALREAGYGGITRKRATTLGPEGSRTLVVIGSDSKGDFELAIEVSAWPPRLSSPIRMAGFSFASIYDAAVQVVTRIAERGQGRDGDRAWRLRDADLVAIARLEERLKSPEKIFRLVKASVSRDEERRIWSRLERIRPTSPPTIEETSPYYAFTALLDAVRRIKASGGTSYPLNPYAGPPLSTSEVTRAYYRSLLNNGLPLADSDLPFVSEYLGIGDLDLNPRARRTLEVFLTKHSPRVQERRAEPEI
jgi:hypothetical protein